MTKTREVICSRAKQVISLELSFLCYICNQDLGFIAVEEIKATSVALLIVVVVSVNGACSSELVHYYNCIF